jgi:hypothetical protein
MRAADCERLAGALFYREPCVRVSDSAAVSQCAGHAGVLEEHGISLRRPFLLVHAAEIEDAYDPLAAVCRYWRALGLSIDLVLASGSEAVAMAPGETADEAISSGRFGITRDFLAWLESSAGLVVRWADR